jgi:hypothetical protein
MESSRVLAAVSAAQLVSGLCGMALAVRRRHAFDVPYWHGQESSVGRDSVLVGTALSAPVVMLGAQAAATTALLRRPEPVAARMLGGLGATMVAGYLAERLVRHRLTPSGWDATESPVIAAGLGLAAVMALIGLHSASAPAETGRAGAPA